MDDRFNKGIKNQNRNINGMQKDTKDDPQKFSDLNPETQKFLRELNQDEIKEYKEAIEFFRKAKTVSTFFTWILLGFIGAVITFTSLWDSLIKIKLMLFK